MLSLSIWLSLITLLVWMGFPLRIPAVRVFGALVLILGSACAYGLLKPAQAAPAPSADPPCTDTDTNCVEAPSETEPAPDPIGAGSDEVNVEAPALNSSDAGVAPITCTNPRECGDPKAPTVK
jgi:hypothetical protein